MSFEKRINEYVQKKQSRSQFNFIITEYEKENLVKISKKKKISIGEIIRLLIDEYIEQQQKEV